MKKLISVFVAVALIIVLAVPAQAADNDNTWTELLETATVNDSGNNIYTLNGASGFFTIKTPIYMRCTKVDIVISHASGYSPKFLKVRYNGGYYTLTRTVLDANTTRFYGDNIPDTLYADLVFEIAQNGTGVAYYQIVSCKVTSLTNSNYKVNAYSSLDSVTYNTPFSYEDLGDVEAADIHGHYQFALVVPEWQKYDKIVISGSIGAMALNSVRVNIGGLGLPYNMNFAVSNNSGGNGNIYTWNEIKYYTYDESYKGTSESDTFFYTDYLGKVLFTITIDLSSVDHTVKDNLYCVFSTLKSDFMGCTIQFQDVMGSVSVADTSKISWWNRFTSFMSSLFGEGEGQDAINDLGQSADSISQGASDIHSFEQSQQAVLDSAFPAIQSAVSFTSFSAALLFVQKYANLTVSGISKYVIVFTLPLFLGLFFYLCSRVPGITRWKPRTPQKKGGKSP